MSINDFVSLHEIVQSFGQLLGERMTTQRARSAGRHLSSLLISVPSAHIKYRQCHLEYLAYQMLLFKKAHLSNMHEYLLCT